MESLNDLLWDVNEDENGEITPYANSELKQICLSLSCENPGPTSGGPCIAPYSGKTC